MTFQDKDPILGNIVKNSPTSCSFLCDPSALGETKFRMLLSRTCTRYKFQVLAGYAAGIATGEGGWVSPTHGPTADLLWGTANSSAKMVVAM